VIGVKPASVHTYRSRIMAKLEIRDIASLVRFAIRQGLIRP
jgi:DNA-binding NarL/FixJ family response regulator